MAATPDVLVSVEEYLRTTYHPDCDYVDGVIEERNVGEGPHSLLQGELLRYVGNLAKQLNIRVWPEQRVRVSPTRYRIPDVCVTLGRGPVPRIIESAPRHLHGSAVVRGPSPACIEASGRLCRVRRSSHLDIRSSRSRRLRV